MQLAISSDDWHRHSAWLSGGIEPTFPTPQCMSDERFLSIGSSGVCVLSGIIGEVAKFIVVVDGW